MRKRIHPSTIIATVALFFSLGGASLASARAGAVLSGSAPACPAGMPTQTITVVNQASVRPKVLAKVENAVVIQSMQLRAAWGTPCVQFGTGGWPLYLQINSGINGNVHYYSGGLGGGTPYAYVQTAGSYNYNGWSEAFSHEIVEMLVDPSTTRDYYAGESTVQAEVNGVATTATALDEHALEVADPVEMRGYRIGGVYVTDFVLPSWYAGAQSMPPSGCDPAQGIACGPPIASPSALAPYDEMGILAASWDTQWERPS